MRAKELPDKALQKRLREWIDRESLHAVVQETKLGRGQLSQYLAGLPMNTAVLRGIESTLHERGKNP